MEKVTVCNEFIELQIKQCQFLFNKDMFCLNLYFKDRQAEETHTEKQNIHKIRTNHWRSKCRWSKTIRKGEVVFDEVHLSDRCVHEIH